MLKWVHYRYPVLHEMLMLMFVHRYVHHRELLPDIFRNYLFENELIHDHNTCEKSDFKICGLGFVPSKCSDAPWRGNES